MQSWLKGVVLGAIVGVLAAAETQVLESPGVLFDPDVPGYLFSVGAQQYLGQIESREEKLLWIKGAPSQEKAMLLRIHRVLSNGNTYHLIATEESDLAAARPKERRDVYPHYDTSRLQVLGVNSLSFIHVYPNTGRANVRFSFSPPVLKHANAFKIYLLDRCLELGGSGFLRAADCVETLSPRGKRQLFAWHAKESFSDIADREAARRFWVAPPPPAVPASQPPVELPAPEKGTDYALKHPTLDAAAKHSKQPYIYPMDE